MNDQEWADRFSRDVDGLLSEAGRMDSAPLPPEYRQAVELAHILATTDFSAESQVRQPLRNRLLNQVDIREGRQRQESHTMCTISWRCHLAVTAATVVLISLLVVTLARPYIFTTVVDGIRASLYQLVVGRHTIMTQTAYPDALATVSAVPGTGITVQSINVARTALVAPAPPLATPVVVQRSTAGLSSRPSVASEATSCRTGMPLCTVAAP